MEAATLNETEIKATSRPTTSPTYQAVTPRASRDKKARPKQAGLTSHEAKPTANGEQTLIRALGLKIGKIVVDAGHGGHDAGTIGPDGLTEKELVLDVALRLGKLLENRMGAEVVYTRDDDTFVPLETRTAIANKEQADLFISIHANSSDDINARGVETYYVASTPAPVPVSLAGGAATATMKPASEEYKLGESHKLAVEVQQAMYRAFGGEKGVLNRGVKQAPFIVLLDATMPSILAEVAFVSNTADEQKLSTADGQDAVADALYRGIARYLSTAKRDKVVASVSGQQGN